MELSEAEIQVLATVCGAELEDEPTDRASLDQWGKRYGIFREDWSGAFPALVDKGLLAGDEAGYRLTDAGRPLGDRYRRERPDMYWYYYQRFYPAAHASAAHSRFCDRVYGRDLCQEGQTDMAAVDDLIALLGLQPTDHVLDLGCGAGGISEYISDRTGAMVSGLDYSASAIATAKARTAHKRARLDFFQADLNDLSLPMRAYDAAISFDSVYWAADMAVTLARVVQSLRPGGQLAILIVQTLFDGAGPEQLEPDRTPVAQALSRLGVDYRVHDRTAAFRAFWPRVRESASALREDFEDEGNGFIADNWIREADEEYLPALAADEMRRYLYHVRL